MDEGSSRKAAAAGCRAQQGNKVATMREARMDRTSTTDLTIASILVRVH